MIKIGNILLGYVFRKQFTALHTILNKVTGVLLFLLPLVIFFVELKYVGMVVCAVATISAMQEGYYLTRGRDS